MSFHSLLPKLAHKYRGPYRIFELTPTNAKIVSVAEPKAKPLFVHINRLKLAHKDKPKQKKQDRKQENEKSDSDSLDYSDHQQDSSPETSGSEEDSFE